MQHPRLLPFVYLLALFAAVLGRAQTLTLTPVNTTGVYSDGQPIAWTVTVTGDATALKNPAYKLKLNGRAVIAEGTLDLGQPEIRIEAAPLSGPATLLAELTATGPDDKTIKALGGAVVEPTKIRTVIKRPADFDAFWKDQLAALAAVPANVQLEPADSGRGDVEYFKVTFDNVDGAKIRAQLARPKNGTGFPAIISTQWAGVYGLNKSNVIDLAARGWLAINLNSHDLPIDESPEFYKEQGAGPLKDYPQIGNQSRETSYFRRMLLGNSRAADYIAGRPDWDGRTLVAKGGSQGGYQSIVLAALEPRITAVLANIPAGCEITGSVDNRANGWPGYWLGDAATRDAIIEASLYYDAVNFGPLVKVPTLVGLGLIDTTCPSSGVFSMFNELAGPKESVIHPLLGHQGPHKTYEARATVWLQTLAAGQPIPEVPLAKKGP